jgi:5'-methylthioadenosine/S-adenosylhomocysteine nucleosidase
VVVVTGRQHEGIVVVLTALTLEYQAVGTRLDGLRQATHERGAGFEIGSVPGTSVEVVVGRTGEGNVAAAVVAQRAIEVFRPRAVLLVGVAGALSDAIGLGDVVVATRVYAVHGGKEEDGRFYARPRAFEAGHALLNLAVRLDAGRIWQSEGLDGSAAGFRVHFKPVASGETVVNSREGSLAALVRQHYNDAVAIEMESAGVAQAAHAAEVPMLTIRGISDRADGRKQAADAAGGQPVAAAHAATVATAVIQHWASTVSHPAGRSGDLPPAAGSAVVYNALPPDTMAFTGRSEEIAWITAQAHAASAVGRVVAISALDGMPGIGKSALALHLAHRLSTRFPDRQLFVALHAHSEDRPPADPALLLAGLLVGDGLDPRALPARLDELSAMWRARIAGRRVLLVLDDAASSAQVAPLLPGTGSCLVLVTSRRHLGDLPYAVYQLTLDVLPQAEAVAMFRRLAPRATRQGERAVLEVVQAAGRLPLAIALYAALYRKHPTWTLADLATEARTAGVTLAAEQRTLATAFDLSYRTLPAARQRFFRRLGLHIGTDLDLYAAAALTGTDLTEAERHLDALLGDRLLTETAYHRYGMHDLILQPHLL